VRCCHSGTWMPAIHRTLSVVSMWKRPLRPPARSSWLTLMRGFGTRGVDRELSSCVDKQRDPAGTGVRNAVDVHPGDALGELDRAEAPCTVPWPSGDAAWPRPGRRERPRSPALVPRPGMRPSAPGLAECPLERDQCVSDKTRPQPPFLDSADGRPGQRGNVRDAVHYDVSAWPPPLVAEVFGAPTRHCPFGRKPWTAVRHDVQGRRHGSGRELLWAHAPAR
jgi:hypothetical protein